MTISEIEAVIEAAGACVCTHGAAEHDAMHGCLHDNKDGATYCYCNEFEAANPSAFAALWNLPPDWKQLLEAGSERDRQIAELEKRADEASAILRRAR